MGLRGSNRRVDRVNSTVVLLTECNHSAETENDKTGGA